MNIVVPRNHQEKEAFISYKGKMNELKVPLAPIVYTLYFVLFVGLFTGCSHTVNTTRKEGLGALPPQKALSIQVDKDSCNEAGEAVALENGLISKFQSLGYKTDGKELVLNARIIKLERGSTTANIFFGLGIGKDAVDVEVKLLNASEKILMSFIVSGEVLDKRYSSLHEVLTLEIPEKIAEEIQNSTH